MKDLKLNDDVVIAVNNVFGTVPVTFTIIAILPNYHYALLAQDKVIVGQLKVDMTWILSDHIDLHSLRPVNGVYHKTLNL